MCDAKVGNEIAEWLLDYYPEDVGAVVTVGEGKVTTAALEKGIPSIIFVSESQLYDALSELAPFDLGILAWWPKLISRTVLSLAQGGFINTHPSLLPYNRGKHFNFWALVEAAPFGVSIHFVDEGIDSGDIVAQQVISYDWEDTGETLYLKAAQSTIDLFKSTYPQIRNGAAILREPQDLNKGSLHYAREIDLASTIELDKKYTARELINLLRARTFPGFPACSFEEDGKKYEISVIIKRKFE
jgi:methionyl-tRNA formyltransferase